MALSSKKKLIAETAALGIPEAVLQKCLDRPLGSVLLSRIYAVPSGWEAKELASAKGITVVRTVAALKTAFQSREKREILLLKSAGLSLEALKKQLETQGNPKTIFFEQ